MFSWPNAAAHAAIEEGATAAAAAHAAIEEAVVARSSILTNRPRADDDSDSDSDDEQLTWAQEADVKKHDHDRDWVRLAPSELQVDGPPLGTGVFAMRTFSEGDLITRVSGSLMTREEACSLGFTLYQVELGDTVVRLNPGDEIHAREHGTRDGIGMFVNSADFTEVTGNVKYVAVSPSGRAADRAVARGRIHGTQTVFYICAMRDIGMEEELLVPTYGYQYWFDVMRQEA